MPEHVHVLVYPPDAPQRMSGFLQAVKEPVARKAIRYLKSAAPQWLAPVTVREGPRLRHRFWQPGGGHDRNLTSTAALRAAMDYLHANPVPCCGGTVCCGTVSRPCHWPDRRSPQAPRMPEKGDLRSLPWHGLETVPQRGWPRFWQPGGGYNRNLTSTAALRAAMDYIPANPVRRGLVARAEDWQWSSARWYAGLRPVQLEIDRAAPAELARG
jgi:REP element-mobilizing transposase RayT